LPDYARQLKVTEARLNDVCRRMANLASKEVVHDRLLQEARRLGITVQPVDVTVSQADCTLEDDAAARERWRTALAATLAAPPGAEDTAANPAPDMRHQPAIRLGLRLVKHLSAAAVGRIVAARQERAYDDVDDLVRRAELDRGDREALSAADAL
ncbi:MAG: hypothetical protein JNK74_28870, partial [Candidatus Hydrogenedentes bacterium]|nr:hypothetical protein [Candidatus Hydrogenedentota bacterium]